MSGLGGRGKRKRHMFDSNKATNKGALSRIGTLDFLSNPHAHQIKIFFVDGVQWRMKTAETPAPHHEAGSEREIEVGYCWWGKNGGERAPPHHTHTHTLYTNNPDSGLTRPLWTSLKRKPK